MQLRLSLAPKTSEWLRCRKMGAVLWWLASAAACAQEASPLPASPACTPASNWQTNMHCLNEQTVFIDIALEHSLKKVNELLPAKQSEQFQVQQQDWLLRRDQECTPVHRPPSDSNALAYAALCRSKMTLQRTSLLESILLSAEPIKEPRNHICHKGEEASLACLSQQRDLIETAMRRLYISILLKLPEPQSEQFYIEQKTWENLREQKCQLNGYVNEQKDQLVCHTLMSLELVVKSYKRWLARESSP